VQTPAVAGTPGAVAHDPGQQGADKQDDREAAGEEDAEQSPVEPLLLLAVYRLGSTRCEGRKSPSGVAITE
jgi:hypothetical protein